MRPFSYERPDDLASAVQAGSQQGAYFIAGGTNLLDLMKVDVERPRHLVDVSRLPLKEIEENILFGESLPAGLILKISS